jgi:hypothetical protein
MVRQRGDLDMSWGNLYTIGSAGTGGAIQVNMITDSIIEQVSATSVSIEPMTTGMTATPTSYSVYYIKMLNETTPSQNAADFGTITSTTVPLTVTGLTPGDSYKFKTTAFLNGVSGNWVESPIFTMSKEAITAKIVSSAIDEKKLTAGKSYLTLTNENTSQRSYSLVYRDFDAIRMPAGLEVIQTSPGGVDTPVTSYSTLCYSFGTTFFLDSNIKNPNPGGGMGFFVNELGSSGYYIFIESTSLSVSQDSKSVKIVKIQGNKVKVLSDTQSSAVNTLEGVYGGQSYAVDVKVKISGINVEIVAYINGFKIVATDKTNYQSAPYTKILGPSQTVALLCTKGTAHFDYVYGTDITIDQYNDSSYVLNFYQGQFSNDLLNTSFGDLTYYADNSTDVFNSKKTMVDEFGTVVREIIKQKVRFENPSYPIKWTTGGNKLAQIIGSKISNFGGEAYVLNNASTTIPLSDNNSAKFYLFGNQLGQSGTLEYETESLADYINQEPVIFESKWLQNLQDVKSLADWIKAKVVNRGKIVSMSIFGNPLISVGDIVTIKYTYQGFAGTEKLIVSKVMHRYNEGLETSIVCRTLG